MMTVVAQIYTEIVTVSATTETIYYHMEQIKPMTSFSTVPTNYTDYRDYLFFSFSCSHILYIHRYAVDSTLTILYSIAEKCFYFIVAKKVRDWKSARFVRKYAQTSERSLIRALHLSATMRALILTIRSNKMCSDN